MKTWADTNALYQVYPRSFMDANGDGIGDIQGIIDRLDYLKGKPDSLGVDAIWISPIYPSPMDDFGYDVSDYCGIHPMFGDLGQFKILLKEAHRRDIKVMLDLVPNHTSDQHPWFQDALRGKDSPKRDYYVWHDPEPDGSPPNNWMSIFGGSMWTLDKASGQYYLHSFLSSQPDLNWENPAVREEIKKVLRFWLDMGVDGFRVDAVWHMSKDPDFRDNPINPRTTGTKDDFWAYIHKYSKYGPRLVEYLREIAGVIESYPDRMAIYEAYPDALLGDPIRQYREFYDVNPRVSAPFNFEGMHLGWNAVDFRRMIKNFQAILEPGDTPVYCFSNHDQMRVVTRFGREHARLIAMLQLTLPGMPTIYYGDEIGMENGEIRPDQIQDPSGRDNPMGGRDPERTPMQWDASRHAGFSSHTPWLPVAQSFTAYNVAAQKTDPDSFLSLYRALLALRSQSLLLVKGSFVLIDSHHDVLAYERSYEGNTYVVALNFSEKPRNVFMSYTGEVICATHPIDLPEIKNNGETILRPFEGIIVKV